MTDALALAPEQYLKHEDFQPYVTIKERPRNNWHYLFIILYLKGASGDIRAANQYQLSPSNTVECTTFIFHGEGSIFPLG